jgi:hypothetical protein
MHRAPIDSTRLPTTEEFNKIAGDFAQRATIALLPGILRYVISQSPPGLLPEHLRHLLLYGPYRRSDSGAARQTARQSSLSGPYGGDRHRRPRQIDPARLPTTEAFDRIVPEFTERAALVFLPGILRQAILEIAQSGVFAQYLRHLILYGRHPTVG